MPVIAIGCNKSMSPMTQASAGLKAPRTCRSVDGRDTLEWPDRGTDAANQMPDDRRLLDEALEPAPHRRQEAHRPAAPAGGGAEIVQVDAQIGPFKLVALVADCEIEPTQPKRDRVREQLAQVKRARSVTGQPAVTIARQHVVIAVAKHDSEIRRRARGSDVHTADVSKMPGLRV